MATYIVTSKVKKRFSEANLQMRSGTMDSIDRAVDEVITETIKLCGRFKSVRPEDVDFVAKRAGAELIRKGRGKR